MKRILLSLLTTALLAPSALAQATSHERINYQAYATNTSGVEYGDNTPANYTVQFRIYDAATGGTALWGEQQQVTIHDGRFSVMLGNGTAISGSGISHDPLSTIFTDAVGVGGAAQNRYIGVKIGNDAEFAPRQQLVANPIAMRAASAAVADTVAGGSINSAAIADASINGTDLAALTVQAANLADGAVNTNKLADGAVNSNKLGADAVTNVKMADNAVGNAEMADNAVGNAEMADNAVGNAELRDDAVTRLKLANGAVNDDKLEDGAVNMEKLADHAVTSVKIADGAVGVADADFVHVVGNGIQLHLPSQQPSTGTLGYPAFELNTANGGTLYFNAWPNGASGEKQVPTMFCDNSYFLRMYRHHSDTAYAQLANNGHWSSSSDVRLKKDITPAGGLLEKALRIKPVHYHWKTEAASEPAHFGVIAQDVEQVIPELVNKGDSWTVNYSGLGVVAIGAIQEQQVMLKDQGARMESLEKENADLKARLERLEQALGTIK